MKTLLPLAFLLSSCQAGYVPEYHIDRAGTRTAGATEVAAAIEARLQARLRPSPDRPIRALRVVLPDYPPMLQLHRTQGVVSVLLRIREDGTVEIAQVRKEDNTHLVDAVHEAVKLWRFEPMTMGGRPYSPTARYEFSFHIQ